MRVFKRQVSFSSLSKIQKKKTYFVHLMSKGVKKSKKKKTTASENQPWILINWPNLSAAPRILVSLSTKRRTFASDSIGEVWESPPEEPIPLLLRSASDAVPHPSPAAKPVMYWHVSHLCLDEGHFPSDYQERERKPDLRSETVVRSWRMALVKLLKF